ncbi:MAG: hypothetical protein P8X82_08595, partial [Gemmatimonadales bacterium]
AYLRRAGDEVVLVVVNLSAAPLSGVTVSSEEKVLTAGRYEVQSLLDGPPVAPVNIGGNGRIEGYMPLSTIGPSQSYVFVVVEAGR